SSSPGLTRRSIFRKRMDARVKPAHDEGAVQQAIKRMNFRGLNGSMPLREPDRPVLVVPYMWIGDFVRCHTVVRLLRRQHPSRPIDVLTTTMVSPLLDYMPGVRKGIVVDLPRKRLAISEHRKLAQRLGKEGYAQALIMPRTWKSALA